MPHPIQTHRLVLLLLALTTACRSAPHARDTSSTPDTHHAPHPWPMVHHGPDRSGGSMDTPLKEAPPTSPPRTLSLPGKLHHLNAPVISNTGLGCIGSVGESPDAPDPHDGVYCVDLDTFTLAAFLHTSSDALHTTLGAAHLFVATADGDLLAIELASLAPGATPKVAWQRQLPAVATSPSLIPSTATNAPLLVADTQGNLLAIDQHDGSTLWHITLPAGVVAPLSSHDATLIVATVDGDLLAIDLATHTITWHHVTTYLPQDDRVAFDSAISLHRARIEAAPVIDPSRRLVVIAYMRGAPQSTPPFLAIDLDSGDLLWEASANTPHRSTWYDQHVAPVLVEDRLIFIEPFSPLTAGVSLDDGQMLFLSNRPSCIQRQRSSIVHASDLNYVPRHDGTLIAMTSGYGLSPWFAIPHTPAALPPKSDPYFATFRAAYEQGECLEDPPDTSGFLTTPALTVTGDILLGRADGTLLLYR